MDNCLKYEQEPYRATKLWNEIIRTFRSEMPRGKHRRHMRQHENCFAAYDAVSWLQLYLKSNHKFGPDVSRHQATQLLNKFLQNGVFEDVKAYKHKRKIFRDDNRLYVFLYTSPKKSKSFGSSPSKTGRRVLAPLGNDPGPARKESTVSSTNGLPDVVKKSASAEKFRQRIKNQQESGEDKEALTIFEVREIWKLSVVNRLEKLLKVPSLNKVLDLALVNSQHLIHNSYRISKSGVVTLLDKTEELPHWVHSAMKCLVNWPNASGSGSCLPKYIGFEKDVFRVIVDYYTSLPGPLISHDLFRLFITIFVRGMFLDVSSHRSREAHDNTYESMQRYRHQSTESINNDRFESSPLFYVAAPDLKANQNFKTPKNLFYETDFESNVPVTRLVEGKCRLPLQRCSEDTYIDMSTKIARRKRLDRHASYRASDSIRHEADDVMSQTLTRSISVDTVFTPLKKDVHSFARRSERCSRSPVENQRGVSTLRKIKRCQENRRKLSSATSCHLQSYSNSASANTTTEGYVNHGFKNQSQEDLLKLSRNRSDNSLYYSAKSTLDNSECASLDHSCAEASVSLFCEPVNYSQSYFQRSEVTMEAMQLGSLFMPAVNRRHLHLLFRVINKISDNPDLHLSSSLSNKQIALKALAHSIMRSTHADEGDGSIIEGILNFLLDNCEAIFRPHFELKKEVEDQLQNSNKIKRIPINAPITYCDRISVAEFENQKQETPANLMVNLLENILANDKISEKQRTKKLVQFKSLYPEVYHMRFPDAGFGRKPTSPKSKLKSSRSQIITRLKNIRI